MRKFIDFIQVYNPFRFIALRYLRRQVLNARKAKETHIENCSDPNLVPAHITAQQLYFAYLMVKFVDVTRSGEIVRLSKLTCHNDKVVVEDAVDYYLKKNGKGGIHHE